MSKSSPNSKNDFCEEKRKLLYWLTQWKDDESFFENKSLDIKEISILLQTIGFRLEKNFEKVQDVDTNSSSTTDNNILKIEVTCPKSGLRSILIKESTSCKCPPEETVNEGEFWSVSGSAPFRRGSINSSTSSLLPNIPTVKSQVIRGLLGKAIGIINEIDGNENEENSNVFTVSNGLVRHRSLDTLRMNETTGMVSSKGIKRRPSWEVDPKTSPPIQTSSPVVPYLCHSLGQLSLDSEKSNTVIKNLENIKKLVEETLDIAAGSNLTYTKNNIPTKRVSDIQPLNNSVTDTTKTFIRSGSTPRRMLTPKKKLLSSEKEKLSIPSRIGSLKKTLLTTVTAGTSGTATTSKNNTPSPNFIKKNILKSGESKIAVKSRIAVKSNNASSAELSTSGTRKPQVIKKTLSLAQKKC